MPYRIDFFPGDDTKLGIVKNTVLGLPRASNDVAKKVIATGYRGLAPSTPTPVSFPQALREGVALRKQQTYDQFAFDRNHPEKGIGETAMNFVGGTKVVGDAAVKAALPVAKPIFEGFTDLSTKTLEKLRGRSEVSRQFIQDATNSPDLKQAERDLIRNQLESVVPLNNPAGNAALVDVPTFANKVKSELLPLERMGPEEFNPRLDEAGENYHPEGGSSPLFENIVLPDELRGPVANYTEHVYESPIETSAGSVHFSYASDGPRNYFAHTRVEDLPVGETKQTGVDINGWPIYDIPQQGAAGGTRRVIEIQSDLFQKGRLENEVQNSVPGPDNISSLDGLKREIASYEEQLKTATTHIRKNFIENQLKIKRGHLRASQPRQTELAKLEPYRNTWHERIIREEVKQAALDGKTKLQFPTGETAMKIEGLGENNPWFINVKGIDEPLTLDLLKEGGDIGRDGEDWVITTVLGGGRFKAIPKKEADRLKQYAAERTTPYKGQEKDIENQIRQSEANETFDISGKVDTQNPIYRFYEKEVGRYLTNKYGAKRVKDAQSVEWYELDVDPKKAKLPVEAYGIGAGIPAAGLSTQREEK